METGTVKLHICPLASDQKEERRALLVKLDVSWATVGEFAMFVIDEPVRFVASPTSSRFDTPRFRSRNGTRRPKLNSPHPNIDLPTTSLLVSND